MKGTIKDCQCEYDDVNSALPNFYLPLLRNITRRYGIIVVINIIICSFRMILIHDNSNKQSHLRTKSIYHCMMANISTFFRYFRVDLERSCPFWQEDGSCMMEGCSVCVCDDNEIPRSWLDSTVNIAYSSSSSSAPKSAVPSSSSTTTSSGEGKDDFVSQWKKGIHCIKLLLTTPAS